MRLGVLYPPKSPFLRETLINPAPPFLRGLGGIESMI